MSFEKFRVLFWKNWTLQKRRPISGVIQVLFPIVLVVLATWARNSFGNQYNVLDRTPQEDFKLKNFTACVYDELNEYSTISSLHFASDNEAFRGLIEEAFGQFFPIIGHANGDDLRSAVYTGNEQKVGINLLSETTVSSELPNVMRYDIFARYYIHPSCEVMFQNEVEKIFIKRKTGIFDENDVLMRPFPFEDSFKTIFTELMTFLLPFFLVTSSLSIVSAVLKSVYSEQKTKVKELMKIMGLSKTLHWLSWYTKWMTMSVFSYTIATIFLCFPIIGSTAIFQLSNFFLIWIFFVLYCSSIITFCFLICVLFQKTSSIDGIGTMAFFATYLLYFIYGTSFDQLSYAVRWLICIPVNTSLGVAISMALNMEVNMQGVTLSNLFTHIEGFQFSFGEVLICLIISSVIHILITVYIEMVFPGEVGIPKPWYFPISPCLKLIRKNDDSKHFDNLRYSIGSFDAKNNQNKEFFEEEPINLQPTIKIQNLTKYFGSSIAVNNVNLNMYQDQIFVLCGHNGAGKTTTMSMLIGMIPPSSGTAYINGYDINTDIEKARSSMGICPQQNILFNDLTVREHIIFFCRLKGMKNSSKIDQEVKKYINILGLNDKVNTRSKALSGGQKRRLSIANALCGQSTFVILDEPTSGLDIKARRNLWDLLIEEKKGRTILLSTHYMEEAEVLSDRIAIMNEGKLKTLGTSFFLKKKFGSGYRLIIVKKENCQPRKIKEIISSYAPDVTIESDEQMEVTFVLSDEYLEKFDKIFKLLEDNSETLGISSFGCSNSSLEEVFLKVGVDIVQKEENNHEEVVKISNPFISTNKVPPLRLFFNQIYAMILKKIHYSRRNLSPYIYLTLVTAGLTAIILAFPTSLETNFDVSLKGLIQTNNSNSSMVNIYKSLLNENNVEVIDEDIREFIYKHFMKRNLKYSIGVSLDLQPPSVWFNNFQLFDVLFSLNFYHRTLLKSSPNCGDCDVRNYYRFIDETTTSAPNSTPPSDDDNVFEQFQEIFIYLLYFILMIYWPSIHIVMRIKENESKAKLLQFISGVNRFLYTFVTYLIDCGIFLCAMCIVLAVTAATGRSGFDTSEDIVIYVTVFTFYGFNIIAWIYLISFLFTNPRSGESASSYIALGFAFIYLAYAILYHAIAYDIADNFAKIIFWPCLLFAPFSLINIYEKIQVNIYFKSEIWDFKDGIGINLLIMSIGTLIFLTIIFMNDFFIFAWFKYKFLTKTPKNLPSPNPTADNDVQHELEKVKNKNSSEINESHLLLDGLSKFYGNNMAVNQLHVSVESAECFGILGVNGAGKTTTFKMMTGDEIISFGDGFIHGYDLKSQITNVYQKIGYCPQFDCLLPDLSGRETMKIICLLRGIPNDEIDEIIMTFAKELGFEKHLDKNVENFSGGNRRKLCTALSLLGNVSLVFLDECSSGMDPKAKRQLWDIINKTRNAGKAVILTSHSMQECESLCTKLAIMVDGSFSCIGSIQHLKNKFSKGFVLTIKMAKRDGDETSFTNVFNRVKTAFPMAELKERFLDLLTFHINSPELKWSEVFEELAKIKREIGIADYTMTQSSLESVFLFFSKQGKRVVE